MSPRRGVLSKITIALTILVLGLSVNATDDKSRHKKAKSEGAPVLWRKPADIASLNLLVGPGGEEMKPDVSKVTFISEEKQGYSKKYRVRDGSGREWVADASAVH